MRHLFFLALVAICSCGVTAQGSANDGLVSLLESGRSESQLVYLDDDGISLKYDTYKNQNGPNNNAVGGGNTNKVPDFSHAGYMGGGVPIPFVPVSFTVSPADGDNTALIQDAIDTVSALPLVNGFRGAVLLQTGYYEVASQLRISASGVVLRGEGSQEFGGTTVTYTSTTQSNMIVIEGKATIRSYGASGIRVEDEFVPTGATTFTVTSSHDFTVGTQIILQQTPNDAWLQDMSDMEQWGWTTQSYKIKWRRVVTDVSGDKITIDAPTVQAIDTNYGGATVFAYDATEMLENIGVENIRLESSYEYGTDEDHGWSAIEMISVQNGWVRQVTGQYFGYGLVLIKSFSSHITVEDSAMINHVSRISPGRRYSFCIDDSDFILVQRCMTRAGRHDYVTQSLTPGPNAFVDSLALKVYSDTGPHHRYSTGQLFDNIRSKTYSGSEGKINVENRAGLGTGHGWSGAQIMFWNCEGKIVCDAPNNAMSYAIGNIGRHKLSYWSTEKSGIKASVGTHVTPRSLYYAQLKARLGRTGLRYIVHPVQEQGDIYDELEAWSGNGLFLSALVIYIDEDALEKQRYPLPIGGIMRDLTMLGKSPTFYWSQVSGPGTASFADATAIRTSVSFSQSGTYELKLEATDVEGAVESAIIFVDAISAPFSAPSLLSSEASKPPTSMEP